MAWTDNGAKGIIASSKVSGTTLSDIPGSDLAVGEVIFLCCVSDDISPTGDTNDHTVTDSTGSNTWIKIREHTRRPGAAGTGCCVSLWVSKLVAAITVATGSITLTLSSAVTAKCFAGRSFSIGVGKTISVVGNNVAQSSGTDMSVTLSSLASAEYLWVGCDGWEGTTADVSSFDADYTTWGTNGTSGGGAASNIAQWPGHRIFTGTSDTFGPQLATARDFVNILAAIQEVDDVVPEREPLQLSIDTEKRDRDFQYEAAYFNPMPQRFGSEPDGPTHILAVDRESRRWPVPDVMSLLPPRFEPPPEEWPGRSYSIDYTPGIELLPEILALLPPRFEPPPEPDWPGRIGMFDFTPSRELNPEIYTWQPPRFEAPPEERLSLVSSIDTQAMYLVSSVGEAYMIVPGNGLHLEDFVPPLITRSWVSPRLDSTTIRGGH